MNELTQYWKAIKKILPIVLPLAAVGLVAGVAYSLTLPKSYVASTTLYVFRTTGNIAPTTYDYDGYYAQQAAQSYTDTVVGLLKTSDIASQAASIASSSSDAQSILAGVSAKKVAPQLISLSVTRASSDQAKADLVALAKAVSQRSASFSDQFGRTYKVEMVNGQPILEPASTSLPFNVLLGLVGGAVVGFVLGSILEYLRR